MSKCQPASSLSREDNQEKNKEGRWVLVDYETQDGLKGVTAYATPGNDPPQVTLPLNAKGPHAIYLGIHYTRHTYTSTLKARLTSDKAFTRFEHEEWFRWAIGLYPPKGWEGSLWSTFHEVFWKHTDLTGQDIVFAQPAAEDGGRSYLSNISYVRIVALNDDEIAEVESEKPRPETKRLLAEYCGGNITGGIQGVPVYHPTTKEEVWEWIEPFRDSDFKIFMWEGIRGDIVAYPSEIGESGSPDGKWAPEWVDPLEVGIEYAHELGMQFYLGMRMVGAALPPVRFPIHRQRFYWENRELAVLDAEGVPVSHLSLAYPEVREHWVSLLREGVQKGVDGVHLLFNRSRPLVLYEKPVVDSFIEKYGEDPRRIDDMDERWLRHRAGYVTQFVKEVRQMLDEMEKKLGKSLGAAHIVQFGPAGKRIPEGMMVDHPLRLALDVRFWIEEGIVDDVILHPCHLDDPRFPDIIRDFKKLTQGKGVGLYADLFPRTVPAEEYRAKAIELYEAGADGFSFWSTEMRTARASEWAMVKMLGHREELKEWEDKAESYFRAVPLKMLNGIAMQPGGEYEREYSHTDG